MAHKGRDCAIINLLMDMAPAGGPEPENRGHRDAAIMLSGIMVGLALEAYGAEGRALVDHFLAHTVSPERSAQIAVSNIEAMLYAMRKQEDSDTRRN